MKTLTFALGLLLAVPAAAQKPSAEDLKPPPVLPKITPNAPLAPAPKATDEDILFLDLSTGGRVTIVMRPDIAPKHVERIRALARQHFYDGTIFHRVIDGFMAQGGDPTGTGQGGSKLPNLKAEFNDLPHLRGTVAMARAGDTDSANSQFYIVFQPVMKLDHNYTVFGRVTGGMDYVDAIERGEPPANPSRIVQASIAADHVPPPATLATPVAATPAALLTPPGETVGAVPARAAVAPKPGAKKR